MLKFILVYYGGRGRIRCVAGLKEEKKMYLAVFQGSAAIVLSQESML